MATPFAIPGLGMHHTDSNGQRIIHYGARGEESSYLLVPYVDKNFSTYKSGCLVRLGQLLFNARTDIPVLDVS